MKSDPSHELETIPAEIVPFAPALYLAWADGRLSGEEIAAVRERAFRLGGIDPDPAVRRELDAWLDPDRPPSAERLRALLDRVHEAAPRLRTQARRSLADLGEELAREQGQLDVEQQQNLRAALEELQAALGVAAGEAARAFLPDEPPAVPPKTSFDPAALNALLDADHRPVRTEILSLLQTEALRPDHTDADDTDRYRTRTLERVRLLAAHGYGALAFPQEFGGRGDVGGSIAVFETLAFGDLSALVKYGVQFGLFAGSIWQLGTKRHHERWLGAAANLELPGCFAMTETGHGSNVRDIETTLRYDADAGEFVVHSPGRSAWKDYIGNAALHGRMATVFAQLEVGGQAHGVHALLVQIRDDAGRPLTGIHIEDCGRKFGLNGIDNGRLAFDNVRVPREHLLDRFGGVRPDGSYTSSITSPTRRFFTMLGTLVAGRVSIAAASLSAAKVGLAIAVRYGAQRRQFGPEGSAEVPVLDYLTMQRRLLPRVATAIALDFALEDLIRTYASASAEQTQEVEGLAAGFKAGASRFASETLAACRQACGGQGYLSENRLPQLIADTDIFTTFEGANTVLLQLVTKGLLTGYREQFEELRLWGAVRYVTGRAAAALADLNPVAPRRTDPAHLRDPEFHTATLRWREERLLGTLARRLKRRLDAGEDSFTALNACQDHAVALGRAHVDRLTLERFLDGIRRCDDPRLRPVLERLAALHALSIIEADRGWFLERGYMEGGKARAIRDQVNALCNELRPEAVAIVDGFGVPDALLAPIAR
jgi:acyl-CoA oxidase